MNRLDSSMQRLSMPPLDKEGYLACLKKLVALDAKWVPSEEGYSLYIRPTAIGTTVSTCYLISSLSIYLSNIIIRDFLEYKPART